ncbi:YsnF/AvaK domain-containing protein [Paracoccus sp. 22332]|uniref:YsnF/AvaK domain-containing protein n=1 Tax=Paracoccus sp. 22332 TaxID=3453913 RepID=UPI003F8379F7
MIVSGVTGGEYETPLDILDDEGSVNLDERAESWCSEGWGGHEASSYASGSTASAYGTRAGATGDLDSPYVDEDSTGADASLRQGRDLRGDETIPIVEERLRVGKRETGQGRVRVRAYTVEEPVNERVDLLEERVQIARRPVDREIEKDNVDGSRDTLSSVDRDNIDRTKI